MRNVVRWLATVVAGYTVLTLPGCATPADTQRLTEGASIAVPADRATAKKMEADLGHLFDALAERHGLVCKICEPLSDGRSYGAQRDAEKTVVVTVNFDPRQGRIYYDLRAADTSSKPKQQQIDAMRAQIQRELLTVFPELQIIAVTPAGASSVWLAVQKARRATSYLDHENQADYQRTLAILDKVANDFQLIRAHPAMYYAGKLLGPNDYEREMTISVVIANDPLVNVRVDSRSLEYADVQRQLAQELRRQLLHEFGSPRVSVR